MKNINEKKQQKLELQKIELQIRSGYGFYGLKYKNAKTDEEKESIIKLALNF